MNKEDLIKNLKGYSPEQIAEAIKSGVVSSYELLHETEGAYTPLLKKKVKQALEQIELSNFKENDQYYDSVNPNNEVAASPKEAQKTSLPEIPSLEVPDINNIPNIVDTETNTSMDKSKSGMFSNPFSFNGRIRRTEYGISMIICFFINLGLKAIVGASSYSSSDASGVLVLYFTLLIPYLWFVWAQGAKRCHDRGNSGWYQIIPFYGFWLLFAEGDSATNEYGVSPK